MIIQEDDPNILEKTIHSKWKKWLNAEIPDTNTADRICGELMGNVMMGVYDPDFIEIEGMEISF